MAKPKKIVYLIGSMRRGGAEGQVLHLLRHFNNEEYLSQLYLLSGTGEHLPAIRDLGISVREFDFESKSRSRVHAVVRIFTTVGKMSRALKADQPDLLHGFLYWANVIGVAAARRAGIPRIVTSRRSLGKFKDGRAWMQALENWTNRRVDAVTVNSLAVRDDTLAREKIDPKRVRVIYNGVPAAPPADRAEVDLFLGEHGGAEPAHAGPKIIACVANLIHYKGHLNLIDAMAEVAAAYPSSRLLLIGRDGGMEPEIRRRIEARGLRDRVALLGLQSRVRIVYGAADLVVLPSDEEGFSNVILEAMEAGKAIVATKVGGVPEAISDGVEGLLVTPKDSGALAEAMLKLLRDDDLRKRLGEAARRRARQEFSLDAMFAAYEKLYQEVLT